MLFPRPGDLGIAPRFPQIWASSPGLPKDWALPPDIEDCPPGVSLTFSSVRRPPQSSCWLPQLPVRPQTQTPACGELPAASAARPSSLPAHAVVQPGLALSSGGHPGDRAGRGSPLRACSSVAALAGTRRPETRAAFVCSLQRPQPWGKRLGGSKAGWAGRWAGGDAVERCTPSGGAAPPALWARRLRGARVVGERRG